MNAWLKRIGLVVIGFVLVAQLVPYGRSHADPPTTITPTWDSPETEALFARACGDCHSNDTRWPWYTNVAPLSWMAQFHVSEGRRSLNVSALKPQSRGARNASRSVQEGEMPTLSYTLLHPEARLTLEEKTALIDGLDATFGSGHA